MKTLVLLTKSLIKKYEAFIYNIMGEKMNVKLFNPQYLGNIYLNKALIEYSKLASGIVMDIGCGESPYKKIFKNSKVTNYFRLDYPNYTIKYFSDMKKPNIYADLKYLPIRSNTIDCVILTQVLEHLTEPTECLRQIHNILKKGGVLFLSFPLIYPIHDKMDYFRFTKEGLKYFTESIGFEVIVLKELGNFWASIGLLFNIYLYYGFFDNTFNNIQLRRILKMLRLILSPVLFLIIAFINVICRVFDYYLKDSNYAQGYFIVTEKTKPVQTPYSSVAR